MLQKWKLKSNIGSVCSHSISSLFTRHQWHPEYIVRRKQNHQSDIHTMKSKVTCIQGFKERVFFISLPQQHKWIQLGDISERERGGKRSAILHKEVNILLSGSKRKWTNMQEKIDLSTRNSPFYLWPSKDHRSQSCTAQLRRNREGFCIQ